MSFNPHKIYPIDKKIGTAVGISIPFNAPAVFNSTYYTKNAIKNNLLNFFLTNKNERYLNVLFGANLRAFIFEQIVNNNLEFLENDIQSLINKYFSEIKVLTLNINNNIDNNEISVFLTYEIKHTRIEDELQITFT